MNEKQNLLSVRNLKKYFPVTKGTFNRVVGQVKAVDDVSFELFRGECLGLVGESGSGKTTVGRCILRALKPSQGQMLFRPEGTAVDLALASSQDIRRLRPHMQMIFQDPYSSLNPRMTIFDNIGEPLLANGLRKRSHREDIVKKLLVKVGLQANYLNYYPHAFSGGQRQRIGIARALTLEPKLIIADEPVSALDVSVQAQILNLLLDLQQELGLTYIFVAHDLSVVRHISDRVAVMYLGELVELADVDTLFSRPLHPYTEALLASIPQPDPQQGHTIQELKGEMADPGNPPPGCRFHPRCEYCKPECREVLPAFRELAPGHFVKCHATLQ